MKKSTGIALLFGGGLALLIAVGVANALETHAHEATVESVERTHEVLSKIGELMLRSQEADAAVRQFVLTSDPASFARSQTSLQTALRSLEALRSLTGNDPGQKVQVSGITSLFGAKTSALASVHSSADATLALQNLDRAKTAEKLFGAIATLRAEELALLDLQMNAERQSAIVNYWLLALRAFFSIPLILLAARWVSREFKMRTAAERVLAAREEQYRQVIELAGDMIFRVDAAGRFTFCNQTMLSALHLSGGEVLGRSWLKMVRLDRRRDAQRFYLRQTVRKQKSTYAEFPVLDGHGHERWMGQNVQIILVDGQIAGYQGIARDITERKQAERELEKSRNFIARIASTTPGILYVYDIEESRVVYHNHALTAVLGVSEEEHIHQFSDRTVHPDDQSLVRAHHTSLQQASDGEIRRVEFRARHAEGHWMWLSARETPFERGAHDRVKRVVGIAQDITERKTAQEKLTRQANSDALTGLANRHHFRTSLEGALRRASLSQSPVALCLFDLDEFKTINDQFGHAAGDEVLEEVGNIVRAELRSRELFGPNIVGRNTSRRDFAGRDIAGRLGGDEFCFALPGTDENECARVAERIRHRLSTLAFGLTSETPFSITATFGVAAADGILDAKELLEAADRALYRAKAAGRNRVCVDA